VKQHYFREHATALRQELREALPVDVLRAFHVKNAARHGVLAARQFAILALCTWALIRFTDPLIWIPLAFVQGFTVFNFTVLLHEVVHHTIFESRRPAAERMLGWLYAVPSGISASQFTRWHLDHHAELGSDHDDPKRAHLSPKRNARWFKLLYCTPALFPIYFRAARKESATYSPALRRQIARERRVSILAHLSVLAAIWTCCGFAAALRAHIVPVFVIFPIAFTLNRLGQHYDIDPADPVKWGTLMRGHWFWDFAFLNSNYHLEHHYFAGVPFYRLPALQRALGPFYEHHHMKWQNYSGLLYGWFIENRAPHTNWSAREEDHDAVAPAARVGGVDLARSDSSLRPH
jgi:fatty acid desaturase